MSTVLEQDHFYSALLVIYVTVLTNPLNRDDEVKRESTGKVRSGSRLRFPATLMNFGLELTAFG